MPTSKPRRKKKETEQEYQARLQEWENSQEVESPKEPADTKILETVEEAPPTPTVETEPEATEQKVREAKVRKTDLISRKHNTVMSAILSESKFMRSGVTDICKCVREQPRSTLFFLHLPKQQRKVFVRSSASVVGKEFTLIPVDYPDSKITVADIADSELPDIKPSIAPLLSLPEMVRPELRQ